MNKLVVWLRALKLGSIYQSGTEPGMLGKFWELILVRPGEQGKTGYFFLLFVLLGCGLALGRGTADTLFFKRYGIENLPMMYLVVSVVLAVVSTIYAAFADRLNAERFFKYLLTILSLLLMFAWVLMQFPQLEWSYPYYYLIYEIASELLMIHASLYLVQNFDTLQAKRLTPLIMGGAQIGVITGGVGLAIMSPMIGVRNIILIWIGVSIIAVIILVAWHRVHGISPYYRAGRKVDDSLINTVEGIRNGLRFMRRSELLRAASFALFFTVVTFYVLIYTVNTIYTEHFESEESLLAFFGILTAVTSSIALILQFFVTNRLIQHFGVKKVNLIFPVTSLLSYLLLLVSYTLPSAIVASVNKDTFMTAFRNPVWNLMLNALPHNIQGRARAMTVAIVIPLALIVSGLLLLVVQRFNSQEYIIFFGLIAAMAYFYFNKKMNAAYVNEIIGHLKQKLYLAKDEVDLALKGGGDAVLQELINGVHHKDDQISLAFVKPLISSFPDDASEIVIMRMIKADFAVRDCMIKLLMPLGSPLLTDQLREGIKSTDEHLQATSIQSLFILRDEKVAEQIPALLLHDNPRLRSVGIFGVYLYGLDKTYDTAIKLWMELQENPNVHFNLVGLELFNQFFLNELIVPSELSVSLRHAVKKLLEQDRSRYREAGLRVLHHIDELDIEWLDKLFDEMSVDQNSNLRLVCLKQSHLLHKDKLEKILEQALEDSHPNVRKCAADMLIEYLGNDREKLIQRIIGDRAESPRPQSAILELLLTLQVPSQLIMDIAEVKAEEASLFAQACFWVGEANKNQTSQALQLLHTVLQERLNATIDLSLQALQPFEGAGVVDTIRAGIKSGDSRYHSAACEALTNLENIVIVKPLAEIMENGNNMRGASFNSLESVIEWCCLRDDYWLQACASRATV